jgi:hypothetical protein
MALMKKPDLTMGEVEEAIGPLERWASNCHGASLALVRSGLLPEGSRVARGWAKGVRDQHSWVLVTPQMVYDPLNWVVDVTLWGYVPEANRLYIAHAGHWPHRPHGQGQLEHLGPDPVGPRTSLGVPVSRAVELFLHMYAPAGLDRRGWMTLLNGPMQGWPSAEIVAAAYRTKELKTFIPMDIVGLLTDENPRELYF